MSINYVEIEGKNISAKSGKKRKWPRRIIFALGIFAVALLALSIYYIPKVNNVIANTKKISDKVALLEEHIQKQDIEKAKTDNQDLRKILQDSKKNLNGMFLADKIPVLGSYFTDAQHSVEAGILATHAGELVAEAITPFGDILGIEGVDSKLTADKKVEVLVNDVLPALAKKSDDLANTLESIKKELDHVDPNHYPEFISFGGLNLKKTLVLMKGSLSKLEAYLPSLKEFLLAVPSVLGYKEEKTYFLWFQNDKELRATGGFISAYGVIKVKGGKITSVDSDDIYQLDLKFRPFETPPPIYKKYFVQNIFPIRDANISPDFKTSAEKFESFYNTIKSMPKIDGIVAIDTELLREFLEFTGPITIKKFKETFSAKNHPVYNIPDVVYKLELIAEKILAGNRDRKGIVGDMMEIMLDKILSSPPERFPELLKVIQESADGKHLQFYFHDKVAQKLAEDLNYAGRIKDYDGDYLHVSNSNVAGLKGNLYTKAQVVQEITIDSSGTVTKKVTTTIKNTGKADGWLNSVYQNWMRVYVPEGSKLITKQVATDFGESIELGKTMWESFSRVKPLGNSVTSFTYKLPFKVKKGQTYKMLIQKQGGTLDPHMTIKLNGTTIKNFDLKKDIEIEFKT